MKFNSAVHQTDCSGKQELGQRDAGMGGGGLSQKFEYTFMKPVSTSPSSCQNTAINAGLLCKRQRSSKATGSCNVTNG